MRYGLSARLKRLEVLASSDQQHKQQAPVDWQARWHDLSAAARYSFLTVVKGPHESGVRFPSHLSVSATKIPQHVLEELTNAGFVEVRAAISKSAAARVYANPGLYDFATRVRNLRKFHLLAADQQGDLAKYIYRTFQGPQFGNILHRVLGKAGIVGHFHHEGDSARYVANHRWPGWVASFLDNPLAAQVLDVVQAAGGSISLADLPGQIKGSSWDEVRSIVDKLVGHLALVEDLHPETWALIVGLLPAVRADAIRAAQLRERPPLLVCEQPRELGPDGGILVGDIRAVLLEITREPPRLRQNLELYQKESERFQASLEPVDDWLLTALRWSDDGRLSQAITWARALQLVSTSIEGKQIRLRLTSEGQGWLCGAMKDQFALIYDVLKAHGPAKDLSGKHWGFTFWGMNPCPMVATGDIRFLGEHAVAQGVDKQPNLYLANRDSKKEDEVALRNSLDRALAVLKPGTYYRLDSVVSHIAFGEHNPLNRGLPMDKVAVFWAHRPVPAMEENREEACKRLIECFVLRRLIPLGCVRAAIDDEGRICIARVPRCDAYFGRAIDQVDEPSSPDSMVKVVVQPDFTVVVIGLNPAPVAELAPFCERTKRAGGQGAIILKITRDSVINAVSNGLKPEEILARLERHASNKAPANVARQVRDWASWVRRVTTSNVSLVRCPDSDTADRVMATLKGQAERITETVVAVNLMMLTATERLKLKAQGIIIEDQIARSR